MTFKTIFSFSWRYEWKRHRDETNARAHAHTRSGEIGNDNFICDYVVACVCTWPALHGMLDENCCSYTITIDLKMVALFSNCNHYIRVFSMFCWNYCSWCNFSLANNSLYSVWILCYLPFPNVKTNLST